MEPAVERREHQGHYIEEIDPAALPQWSRR
jgi:hypothetical protein